MKRRLRDTVLSAGVFVSLSVTTVIAAAADQTLLPVSVCQFGEGIFKHANDAQAGALTNVWSSSRGLYCGVGQDSATADFTDDINVWFADTNATAGENVRCRAHMQTYDFATTMSTSWKYGCSTQGGCTSDPGVFADSSAYYYINIPNIRHGGSYTTFAECYVPGNSQGKMLSVVLVDQ